ncbi:asparagine synthase [Pseudolabrys sp. Root1462]|uniref:asparagine synthase (glutamine-hydrolyzing) n=1 Tax=Pseudolabrys sp. Root1462 TaxID=1736466 RepID=UPI000703552E|nr:asparagine synthase (glutamine-hydrolyzing) [Pseudolabrys sp. Root1462]KQZ00169.1 asparagine synthase [Pseudolabrys sp. Root1462]
MCGIAGFYDRARPGDPAALERRAQAMGDAIAYRGPDSWAIWYDAEAGLGLAHRRLAIVDLTPTGAQPMVSADSRWVICYNGEVYNRDEVARCPELAGFAFRGTSDTEVILESVARRGIERTLTDINGMFAIALWDRQTRTLHLIRDRLGIKPIYFSSDERGIAFASELKALRAGGVRLETDPQSVGSFLRFAYVPAPYSIFRNVTKVMPGEIVSIAADGKVARRIYWSLGDIAAAGIADPFRGSDGEAEAELHNLLADAVAGQMMSDVPLGAFLSGGIDSSTVVALMVAAKRGPVRTFSIGFSDLGFDESQHARAVAEHLKTDHRDLMVTGEDALNVVPQLAEMYDEPFADSSQIPTHLISKLTREHVTVALTGDGGDEMFAGYNRYNLGQGIAGRLSRSPRALRQAAGALLDAMPGALVEAGVALLPARVRPPQPVDKLKKFAAVLPLDAEEAYRVLVSQNRDPSSLMFGKAEHDVPMPVLPSGADDCSVEQMQLCDQSTFLPDDILQKVDRASMAVSLEVRPPLLDHRVVSFAWRLPRAMRVRDGETKWLLRRVLDRYVPREMVSRPKMGFAIPLAAWLRGPLRPWAEDLLDPSRLSGGLLDAAPVRRLWDEHLSGRHNRAYALWTILMYEAWRRRWGAA